MRTFLLMYGGSDESRVPTILEKHGITHYTSFAGGHGAGSTGRREGTRAWPGETTMIVSLVPDDRAESLADELQLEAAGLPAGERLHVAVHSTERFF